MTEQRKELQDRIIGKLGFEHKATIWFLGFCEEKPDTAEMNEKLNNVLVALFDLIDYVAQLEEEVE